MYDLTTPFRGAIGVLDTMFFSPIEIENKQPVRGIITFGNSPWDYSTKDTGAAVDTEPTLYCMSEVVEGDYCLWQGKRYRIGVVSNLKVPNNDYIITNAVLYEVNT